MRVAREIILEPLVTEKGTVQREGQNKYFFKVASHANRLEIRQAIEELFKVKVEKVRTQNVFGKIKRYGRYQGRRSSWKKAIATLAKGSKIELFEGV
jgi:large subunit ribosomal protein L23